MNKQFGSNEIEQSYGPKLVSTESGLDYQFPTPDHLIMEIKTKLFYYPCSILTAINCVEMVNYENGQLVFIDLNKKIYQISHINDQKKRSDFYAFNFSNKDEVELYNNAKGYLECYGITNQCCSIN